jgi:hypothetical protein
MATGTCPECKGKGTETRVDSLSFKQLCRRCQGSGIAKLTDAERQDDFYKKSQQGFATAEQRRAASGSSNRPFVSGIDAISDIRRLRDDIRRAEKRFAPPWEPKPEDAPERVDDD